MSSDFSTIILSSGLSERMGQPKALLKWDKSTTFIEKIINEFVKAGSTKIVCMINEIIEPACKKLSLPSNVELVVNHHPDWGRFYSIRTGVNALNNSDYCFIHNVDNPFVSTKITDKLWAQRKPGYWCSPNYKGKGGHPVLLSKEITDKISTTSNLDFTLRDILQQFPKIPVSVTDNSILRNLNTPEEYNKRFNPNYSSE
ncbi:MAG TPA: NTP transferase domain-containing protein [Perlabentimonas sp.]|jgi:molybdenum cofactor cytidylyltransferase|nr:NTP transferase domain-containing protein [Bacteroidales bacterium]MDD4671519.1 NTP transferase domain-containing protein [Bacteroidales bacterium]MDY0348267.1 NTP transferase domain-containing protein [Tenuifilaceae bacterium]HZJ74543.1 NTP transferase domain-containing protein [Perlabentimonas sp.]